MRLNLPNQSGSPSALFSAAEKDDWISILDRLIIKQALQKLPDRTAHYSINLSAVTASDPDFPKWISDLIAECRIDVSRITFELTETAIAPRPDQVKTFAEFWRSQGGGFALDDFGAGTANVSLLKKLPFSAVKLDKSISDGLGTNAIDLLTVDYLVNAARIANATTIAEGIETEQIKTALIKLGVAFGQGWLLGMPEPF